MEYRMDMIRISRVVSFAIAALAAGPDFSGDAVRLSRLILVAEAQSTSSCIDPETMGAVPNDGFSDRVAIQQAIDTAAALPDGGTVCLGPGRWTVERAPIGSFDRFAALSVGTKTGMAGHHVTIRGYGPETVLELVGDQGAASVNVLDVLPGAEHTLISDLAIDTSAATNTDEQTHAIATSHVCAGATCLPIRDLQITRVTFLHPRNTVSRKGDCIRLLGNTDATRLYDVRIEGNHFEACARSAIMIQRGVNRLTIVGNTLAALKTPIDGEATGGPTDVDTNVTISGNVFRDRVVSQGDADISLTSMRAVSITGNAMDGGVTVYRSTDVTITGNTMNSVATAVGVGTIDAANQCDGLTISGNVIRRRGAAGALVKLVTHSGVSCSRWSISGNTLFQDTASWGIYAESASFAMVSGNQISGSVVNLGAAIGARAVLSTTPTVGYVVQNNRIDGGFASAIRVSSGPGTYGAGIAISGNTAVGPGTGVFLENSAGFTSRVLVSGNDCGPDSIGVLTWRGD